MKYEVEQKYPLPDPQAFIDRLQQLGVVLDEGKNQTDRYYAHPARDFAVTDEALRIRRVGPDNYITYKGPKIDHATKTRQEIELALPSHQAGFEQMGEILIALGFSTVAEVNKLRRHAVLHWQDREVEIVLDHVEHVGTFAELELLVDQQSQLPQAQEVLLSLADQLELQRPERRSYLELLLESQNT